MLRVWPPPKKGRAVPARAAHTDPTVTQALELLNGPISNRVLDRRSVLNQTVRQFADPPRQIRAVFLGILGREPREEELALAMEEIEREGSAGLENVAGALLNTREFLFVQ